MKAPVADFSTDAVTLQYLTNHRSVAKDPITKEWQAEQAFYKKRICGLTKMMSKGTYHTEELKHAYHTYASVLMNHFKVGDRADILQENYNSLLPDGQRRRAVVAAGSRQADLTLTSKPKKAGTLDGFVVSDAGMKPEPLPQIKRINIKTDGHKVKGVVKRSGKK